jgi:hypothetical protein
MMPSLRISKDSESRSASLWNRCRATGVTFLVQRYHSRKRAFDKFRLNCHIGRFSIRSVVPAEAGTQPSTGYGIGFTWIPLPVFTGTSFAGMTCRNGIAPPRLNRF